MSTFIKQDAPFQAARLFSVDHLTNYEYEDQVSLSHHLMHLRPRDTRHQRVLECSLRIEPQPDERASRIDYFGNEMETVAIDRAHDRFEVRASSRVLLAARPPEAALRDSVPWTELKRRLQLPLSAWAPQNDREIDDWIDAQQYRFESPKVQLDPRLADYAAESFPDDGTPVLVGALSLTQRIFRNFRFDNSATDVSTPILDVLRMRRGVCQDFAHLMIGCLRSIGLSARYVSGYILTDRGTGKPRPIGSDASHAWVAVHCPVLGWTDFDPTNNALVNLEHVTVGWGRDFSDVSLVRGIVLGGGTHVPQVGVTVRRLEDPA